MVKEASKAMKRRAKAKEYINQYFVGNGIDIGSGIDCIDQFKKKFKNMKSVKPWDLIDGDATYLDKEMEDLYDFVHSSHCLEHLTDPFTALKNWIRVCKPGGYIIVTIPDEEMFEKLKWPSQFNPDHKWSFTIYNKEKRLPNSVNILDLLQAFENVKIISINVIEQGFNPNVPQSFDQTLSGSPLYLQYTIKSASDGYGS